MRTLAHARTHASRGAKAFMCIVPPRARHAPPGEAPSRRWRRTSRLRYSARQSRARTFERSLRANLTYELVVCERSSRAKFVHEILRGICAKSSRKSR
eukprot:5698080-Pleurochrysis_carterae.AAC.1